MADGAVTVSILRETKKSDGAGGKTVTTATIASGLPARLRQYRRNSNEQLETAAGGQAPGLNVDVCRLMIFDTPYPNVLRRDLLQVAGGQRFRVLYSRGYDDTLQCDCEIIE